MATRGDGTVSFSQAACSSAGNAGSAGGRAGARGGVRWGVRAEGWLALEREASTGEVSEREMPLSWVSYI